MDAIFVRVLFLYFENNRVCVCVCVCDLAMGTC